MEPVGIPETCPDEIIAYPLGGITTTCLD